MPRLFRYAGLAQAIRTMLANGVATSRVSTICPARRTRSTLPRCAPCISTKLSIKCRCTSSPGYRFKKSAMTGARCRRPNAAGASTRINPSGAWLSETASARASCNSLTIRRARSAKARPAEVGTTAWVLRWNRRLPTEFSRLSIRRATAEGVSGWRRAAAEKLPASSTSRNRLSWSVKVLGFMARRLCEIGTAIVRCCAFPRQSRLRSMQSLELRSSERCGI
ncbi:hypothetical protein PFLmoz3_05090 [Pseudomonas fluorescens]|uniref:Uncharacterized protein n=1 Tax=Pseudomonas fluorescens TaxID=294 RepID=A0A109LCP3_PSEFL|nr:hypothetical protein PFLmoz3_05090 [Pseudomonas fluorescens]